MSHELLLTVLGSGGPIADPHRVSSGYVLSLDGKARILVDAGGGIFERIGRAQLDLSQLELVLLTHMHIDHSSDLAAVVMNAYMTGRTRPLRLVGPSAGRGQSASTPEQPGARAFAELLFGPQGAWRYMQSFEGFGLEVFEVPSGLDDAVQTQVPMEGALAELGVSVRSVPVPHGMMPAVAYRVARAGSSVVFSGDIAGSTADFVELARDCSLLVHDCALPEREMPHGNLHAKPSQIGRSARESAAGALLLTHFMPPIESELDAAVAIVRGEYAGPIALAGDLQSYPVGD